MKENVQVGYNICLIYVTVRPTPVTVPGFQVSNVQQTNHSHSFVPQQLNCRLSKITALPGFKDICELSNSYFGKENLRTRILNLNPFQKNHHSFQNSGQLRSQKMKKYGARKLEAAHHSAREKRINKELLSKLKLKHNHTSRSHNNRQLPDQHRE